MLEMSSSDEEPSDQPGKKWLGLLDLTSEVIDLTGELK